MKNTRFWKLTKMDVNLSSTSSCIVIYSKSFNLFKLQIPWLYNKDNSTCCSSLLWGLTYYTSICMQKCLTLSRNSDTLVALFLYMEETHKTQKNGSSPSQPLRMKYGLLSSPGFPGPWGSDWGPGLAQSWAHQNSDWLQMQCILSITLLQGNRKRSSKGNSRNYYRFGFPMQAWCLGLQWETEAHLEGLVSRAEDLWVGFVSTSAPLSTHSGLELPQHAALHKSLFFFGRAPRLAGC